MIDADMDSEAGMQGADTTSFIKARAGLHSQSLRICASCDHFCVVHQGSQNVLDQDSFWEWSGTCWYEGFTDTAYA